jgi:hypothetical protein
MRVASSKQQFHAEVSSMLKQRFVMLCAGLSLATVLCNAQSALLNLPRPSQHAAITQRVGITDITINYHRPLVNKREVWVSLAHDMSG